MESQQSRRLLFGTSGETHAGTDRIAGGLALLKCQSPNGPVRSIDGLDWAAVEAGARLFETLRLPVTALALSDKTFSPS